MAEADRQEPQERMNQSGQRGVRGPHHAVNTLGYQLQRALGRIESLEHRLEELELVVYRGQPIPGDEPPEEVTEAARQAHPVQGRSGPPRCPGPAPPQTVHTPPPYCPECISVRPVQAPDLLEEIDQDWAIRTGIPDEDVDWWTDPDEGAR